MSHTHGPDTSFREPIRFSHTNLRALAISRTTAEHAKEVHGAPAWGQSLVADIFKGEGTVGADIIHMDGGTEFPHHTHPGHHVLIMIHGKATVAYGGQVYSMRPWDFFVIPGDEVHNVGCIEDCTFLAFGWPAHKQLDDPTRMAVVSRP